MKNIKGLHTQVWSMFLLFFIPTTLFAQIGFDKVYSFSPDPNYSVYSAIKSIITDSQRILIIGETLKEASPAGSVTNSSTFLASIDYDGNIQWQKRLSFAPPFQSNFPLFIRLLTEINTNKYVLGAQGFEQSSTLGYFTPRPFLHFFNANGDSLRLSS